MGNQHALNGPSGSRTEQQLIESLALREHRSLENFLKQYRPYLLYHCRRLSGGNTDDANDLFSQVVLRIYTESPDALRRIRHLGGWLRQVAQNKFIDQQRCRIAETQRLQGRDILLGQSSPSSPEQQLLDDELARQIQRAFAALPDRLRSVATLRFVDNLSYEEIAHWQDISQVNARKRVQEARRHLVSALKSYLDISLVPTDTSMVRHTLNEIFHGVSSLTANCYASADGVEE